MTQNQIAYWNYIENQRANKAKEDLQRQSNIETARSNLAKELETNRSNTVKEIETERANRAIEEARRKELTHKYVDTAVRGGTSLVSSVMSYFGGVASSAVKAAGALAMA